VDIYTQNNILTKFNNKLSKSAEINKAVRHCCPPSPTLFNIHLVEIITKWQNQDITGIKLSKNQQLSALLFAEDQVIIADTEDNLQKAAHKLNQIITEYGLTISVQKTKTMAFKGRDTVRTEIVTDNEIIDQVNLFNYLGNMISYEGELDIGNKLNNI
jgi:transcription initiation factor TFIIIB Brf1 subunit/transcription initiation factor TFIIB